MPLVAQAAFAYALGLFVALGGPPALTVVVVAAALLASAVLVRAGYGAGACALAVLAAGVLAGTGSQLAARRCDAQLAAASEWTAELEEPASGGGVAKAALRVGACRGRATLLVGSGRGSPGDVATVRGLASLQERGILVRHAALRDVRRTASLASLRARAGARIDRLFGSDAPLVRALVIADMSAVPAEQRDQFARAGLVHMLSVSGLHVAIIALALELLAGALRIAPVPARIATIVLLAAYVAGIGAPPPAVRAAVMLALLMLSRVIQRPTSPWAVLAVGGVAPLLDAEVVLDLGWQLSVAGTVALLAGGTLASRLLPSSWSGPRRSLARAAIVGIVATVATAPLVAWSFGRIALLGPATNLLADPLMAVLQPVLFLALCVPLPFVERLAADTAHVLIAGFDGVAAHAAAVPWSAPTVMPTVLAACASGVAAVAVLVACIAERPVRAVLVALTCTAMLIGEPFLVPARTLTELHMLDVGQGDAIAIRTRAGRWIVIDAGRTWPTGDAGRAVVVPYIARRGGAVALFVLSHPHADHVGGAASVFSTLHPGRFLDPGYVGTTPAYLAALEQARRDAMPWQRVHPGDSLVVDEVVLTALAPDSSWAAHLDDANLASTVMLARVGDVRILLTGDAEGAEEEWLLEHARLQLAADVLKVAHHGSSTSTTPTFLQAVSPRLALVSVGAHNSYGHPDPAVMSALGRSGATVLRTDLAGTVTVRTDGHVIDVEARGMRWRVPRRP